MTSISNKYTNMINLKKGKQINKKKYLHCGSKKHTAKVLFLNLLNNDQISKLFYWYNPQKNAIAVLSLFISYHTLNASLHYLVKYKFYKFKNKLCTQFWLHVFDSWCYRPTVKINDHLERWGRPSGRWTSCRCRSTGRS